MRSMPVSDPVGRTPRERIIEAASAEVTAVGVDSVTATAVAGRAGVSRPTLYSYFGDVEGVLAEVWVGRGAAWLERLVVGTEPAPVSGTTPDPLLELLAVAPRSGPLADVVVPDLEAVWRSRATSTAAEVRLAWVLGVEVGSRLAMPAFPTAGMALGVAGIMRGLPDDRTVPGSLPPLRIAAPAEERHLRPVAASGDRTVDVLLDASVRVVATAGVAGASLQRIARAARVTTGAVRPRFDDLSSLLEDGLRFEVERVVAENRTVAVSGIEDPWAAYLGLIVGSLHPRRRVWRRYRHELFVAALHDAGLAARVARAVGSTEDVGGIVDLVGAESSFRNVIMMTHQAGALGLSLLHELGLPVAEVDHRIGLEWLRAQDHRLAGIQAPSPTPTTSSGVS